MPEEGGKGREGHSQDMKEPIRRTTDNNNLFYDLPVLDPEQTLETCDKQVPVLTLGTKVKPGEEVRNHSDQEWDRCGIWLSLLLLEPPSQFT